MHVEIVKLVNEFLVGRACNRMWKYVKRMLVSGRRFREFGSAEETKASDQNSGGNAFRRKRI